MGYVASFRYLVAQEAVTGSVAGDVKFWDLRMMQSFKTIEVRNEASKQFCSLISDMIVRSCNDHR
jgi:hypothetical protein